MGYKQSRKNCRKTRPTNTQLVYKKPRQQPVRTQRKHSRGWKSKPTKTAANLTLDQATQSRFLQKTGKLNDQAVNQTTKWLDLIRYQNRLGIYTKLSSQTLLRSTRYSHPKSFGKLLRICYQSKRTIRYYQFKLTARTNRKLIRCQLLRLYKEH